MMSDVIGWDIGGVHTKAVKLDADTLEIVGTASCPYEIWRDRSQLVDVLRSTTHRLGLDGVKAMGITMTAELSDAFRSKREGVLFVLDALQEAFPACMPTYLLNLSGEFESLDRARQEPLEFAAANWLASALWVATIHPNCVLMDIGSTTTDITLIRNGTVINRGRTDPERLAAGELVYTGVERTNPNTLAPCVPIEGNMCRVAAESFAVMGDVYVLLEEISAEDYTGPTPDGRGKDPQSAGERLARLVCADGEMLEQQQLVQLALHLKEKQLQQVSDALSQVLSRVEVESGLPLVVAGGGRFVAVELGERRGMQVVDLCGKWGEQSSRVFPAAAVAALLVTGHTAGSGVAFGRGD